MILQKTNMKNTFFIDSGVNMHDTNVNARIKYYSENQPERRLLKRLTLQKLLPKLCSPKCWNLFLDDSFFLSQSNSTKPCSSVHTTNTYNKYMCMCECVGNKHANMCRNVSPFMHQNLYYWCQVLHKPRTLNHWSIVFFCDIQWNLESEILIFWGNSFNPS